MQMFTNTLYVRNIEASILFYEQVVGLAVTRRFSREGTELAFFGECGTGLRLVQGTMGACYESGIPCRYPVENLDQKLASFKALGIPVRFEPLPSDPHQRTFCVADPDGMIVRFVEQT